MELIKLLITGIPLAVMSGCLEAVFDEEKKTPEHNKSAVFRLIGGCLYSLFTGIYLPIGMVYAVHLMAWYSFALDIMFNYRRGNWWYFQGKTARSDKKLGSRGKFVFMLGALLFSGYIVLSYLLR